MYKTQFKSELGLKELAFNKSSKTQREFATFNVAGQIYDIIISKSFDDSKEAYIFLNEEKGFFVICNSTMVKGRTL